MTAPIAHRRRDSDHPRRRLEDQPGHRRLLHVIVAGVIIGCLTLFIGLSEIRYRDTARSEDLDELRRLTDRIAQIEDRAAIDMRAHRIRTEEYLARLCTILVASHDGITPSDCPAPLSHPADPDQPADTPPREDP